MRMFKIAFSYFAGMCILGWVMSSDHPSPNRDSSSGMSAEDRSASHHSSSAPRDHAPFPAQTFCHRQTLRHANSAVAHIAPEPEEDDPLLAFAPFIHTSPHRN